MLYVIMQLMKRRLFIAINLPSHLQEKIYKFSQTFFSGFPLRITKQENLHFTLIFLGQLDKTKETMVRKIVEEAIKDAKTFSVRLEGLDVFPNLRRPKILWIKTVDSALSSFHHLLYRKLASQKFVLDERPFTAHLTIGRVKNKDRAIKETLPLILKEHGKDFFGEFEVKQADLMESILEADGPCYKIIASYKLNP